MATPKQERVRKYSRQTTSSLRDHARPAAEAMDAGREKPWGLSGAISLSMEEVTAAQERFEAADVQVDVEIAEESAARSGRDASASALRGSLAWYRAALVNDHGEAAAAARGFGGRLPPGYDALLTYGRGVLTAARTAPPLGAPPQGWATWDEATVLDAIKGQVQTLAGDLDEVQRELRETQAARSARDACFADWQRTLRLAIDLGVAALEFQGKHDLAARMFPSARQIGEVLLEPSPDPVLPAPADPEA